METLHHAPALTQPPPLHLHSDSTSHSGVVPRYLLTEQPNPTIRTAVNVVVLVRNHGGEKNLRCREKDVGEDQNGYRPALTLCQNAGGDVESPVATNWHVDDPTTTHESEPQGVP